MLQTPPPPLWIDVTDRALPGVETVCGGEHKRWIVEAGGGGLALEDFDGDGHLDLVVVDGSTVEGARAGEPGRPPRLFLGDGTGGFVPAPEPWGMGAGRWGTGCATGDWNGDGYVDLVVTAWGADRIWLNAEGAGWRPVVEAGLDAQGWSTSATALDYDGDGHLDLFVCGYLDFDPEGVPPPERGGARWKGHAVMAGPEGLSPTPDRLYRGRGDGTFEDVTARAGLDAVSPAYGLGVTTLDFDRDGDTDLYVANDSTPNHLWENRGDGTLREVGFERGVAYDAHGAEQAGMGIACGDLDGDGAQELLVTNFSGEAAALYRASPRRAGRYRDCVSRVGLSAPTLHRLGWGAAFLDADLDGDLDVVTANGHVYPEADRAGTDTGYAQPDQLFLQGPDGRFDPRDLPGPPRVSRALVSGDLDGDGDLDLVIAAVEGPVRVFHGRAADLDLGRGTSIVLRPAAGSANGAALELTIGERSWHAEARSSGGYQAARPLAVHFGLGRHGRIDRLRVRWPGGGEQVLEDVPVRPRIRIEEPR